MVFCTSPPSAMAFLTSVVSSGRGMGASWMLNFSSSSPSLHIVLQKSKGLGPIWRMRMLRKVFTTLQTARKSRTPRSNTGSERRQLVRYVKGTPKRLSTLPVAKRPHCVSRRRVPSGSGRSSRGPQSSTGTFKSLASLAQRYSVPKLQWASSSPSTPAARNFSTIFSLSSSL